MYKKYISKYILAYYYCEFLLLPYIYKEIKFCFLKL